MASARAHSPTLALRGLALAVCGLLLDAAVLTGNTGCTPCNSSVCTSRARLIVGEPGEGPLLAGTYEIALTVDGVATTGSCVVETDGLGIDCDGLEGVQLSAPLFDSAPGTPHTQIWFDFGESLPTTVALRVTFDAAQIVDETIELDYQPSEPGCDDDCRDAIESIEFDRG